MDSDGIFLAGTQASIHRDDGIAHQISSESFLILLKNDSSQPLSPDIWVDKYDIRALFPGLIASPKVIGESSALGEYESDVYFDEELLEELLYERYQDLVDKPEPIIEEPALEDSNTSINIDTIPEQSLDWNHGGYQSTRDEIWDKESLQEKYEVPACLVLPSGIRVPRTKKQYDVILHTALRVREKGAPLEILLKVKQEDNILFDFLYPEHSDFAFYQYIKSLSEKQFWDVLLLKPASENIESHDQNSDRKTDQHLGPNETNPSETQTVVEPADTTTPSKKNALSLLGAYNDDDEDDSENKEAATSGNTIVLVAKAPATTATDPGTSSEEACLAEGPSAAPSGGTLPAQAIDAADTDDYDTPDTASLEDEDADADADTDVHADSDANAQGCESHELQAADLMAVGESIESIESVPLVIHGDCTESKALKMLEDGELDEQEEGKGGDDDDCEAPKNSLADGDGDGIDAEAEAEADADSHSFGDNHVARTVYGVIAGAGTISDNNHPSEGDFYGDSTEMSGLDGIDGDAPTAAVPAVTGVSLGGERTIFDDISVDNSGGDSYGCVGIDTMELVSATHSDRITAAVNEDTETRSLTSDLVTNVPLTAAGDLGSSNCEAKLAMDGTHLWRLCDNESGDGGRSRVAYSTIEDIDVDLCAKGGMMAGDAEEGEGEQHTQLSDSQPAGKSDAQPSEMKGVPAEGVPEGEAGGVDEVMREGEEAGGDGSIPEVEGQIGDDNMNQCAESQARQGEAAEDAAVMVVEAVEVTASPADVASVGGAERTALSEVTDAIEALRRTIAANDDLLDEDVDEGTVYGRPHAVKKEAQLALAGKLAEKVRLQELEVIRAKEAAEAEAKALAAKKKAERLLKAKLLAPVLLQADSIEVAKVVGASVATTSILSTLGSSGADVKGSSSRSRDGGRSKHSASKCNGEEDSSGSGSSNSSSSDGSDDDSSRTSSSSSSSSSSRSSRRGLSGRVAEAASRRDRDRSPASSTRSSQRRRSSSRRRHDDTSEDTVARGKSLASGKRTSSDRAERSRRDSDNEDSRGGSAERDIRHPRDEKDGRDRSRKHKRDSDSRDSRDRRNRESRHSRNERGGSRDSRDSRDSSHRDSRADRGLGRENPRQKGDRDSRKSRDGREGGRKARDSRDDRDGRDIRDDSRDDHHYRSRDDGKRKRNRSSSPNSPPASSSRHSASHSKRSIIDGERHEHRHRLERIDETRAQRSRRDRDDSQDRNQHKSRKSSHNGKRKDSERGYDDDNVIGKEGKRGTKKKSSKRCRSRSGSREGDESLARTSRETEIILDLKGKGLSFQDKIKAALSKI